MLWRRPCLAHLPMVPLVNLTFEAASMPAASASEIQSEGGLGIGQSEVAADLSALTGAAPEVDSAEAPVPVGAGLVVSSAGFDGLTERSLRAQPEPL